MNGIRLWRYADHPIAGPVIRAVCRWGGYLTIVSIVVAALGITVARVWLPGLGERKGDLEAYLSQHSARAVQITSLEAYWRGVHPRLRARGLSLLSQDGTRSAIRLEEVRARIALWPLLFGELVFDELTVVRPVIHGKRLADGRIAIADMVPREGSASRGGGEALVRWLHKQKELRVEQGEFQWRDEMRQDAPLRVTDINLVLRNDGERHRFGGTAVLPPRMGREFSFAADFNSDELPFISPDWKGRLFVQLVGLETAQLPAIARERLPPGMQGRLNAQLWLDWKENVLHKAEGFVRVGSLEMPLPGLRIPLTAAKLEGDLTWTDDGDRWSLGLVNVLYQFDREPWRTGPIVVRGDRDKQVTNIHLGKLRADEFVRYISAMRSRSKAVAFTRILQPGGEAHNLHVTVNGPWSAPTGFSVAADVRDVSILASPKWPGLTGLSGRVSLDRSGGHVELDSTDMTIDLPLLYAAPLRIRELRGRLKWTDRGDHWRILGSDLKVANEDVLLASGALELRMPKDRDRSPWLKLTTEFQEVQAARLVDYYPVRRWGKKTLAWLRQAELKGRLRRGRLFFEGETRDRAAARGPARLEFSGELADVALNFAPGWPRLKDAEGQIHYDGTSLDVTVRRARLHGLDSEGMRVTIDDVRAAKEANLEVSGRLLGSFAEMVRFLKTGPLLASARRSMAGLSGAGVGALELSLKFPLGDARQTQVSGRYRFLDSGLTVAPGVKFEGLNGVLEFTDGNYSSEGIRARAFGGDVRLAVHTPVPGRQPEVVIHGAGNAQVSSLGALLGAAMVAPMSGNSDWTARLRLGRGESSLHVASDLVGVKSALPQPLTKPADSPWPMVIDERYRTGGQVSTHISIGKHIHGDLRFARHNGKRLVKRGVLRLGGDKSVFPDAGLSVQLDVRQLDLDSWIGYFSGDRGATSKGVPEALTHFSARVEKLRFLGRDFDDLQSELTRGAAGVWRGPLAARQAQGTIGVDLGGSRPVFDLALTHLEWPGVAKEPAREVPADPRRVPQITLRSDALRLAGIDLGALHLEIAPTSDGSRIRRLEIAREEGDLTGSGQWRWQDGQIISQYELRLQSSDLGKTFAALGLAGQLEKGTGDIEAQLSWVGGPEAFSLKTVNAQFDVSASNGLFPNLDTGAGKLFGLFNVNAVARRLKLDFSDVFSRGYAYDRIEGRIVFANGQAHSGRLLLKGPAADIQIAGRMGLDLKDNDMTLTVAPQLGGNLALATGLYNPAAGAVVYVLQRVLKKQLAGVVRYHYAVRGSWEDPVIEKLSQSQPQS